MWKKKKFFDYWLLDIGLDVCIVITGTSWRSGCRAAIRAVHHDTCVGLGERQPTSKKITRQQTVLERRRLVGFFFFALFFTILFLQRRRGFLTVKQRMIGRGPWRVVVTIVVICRATYLAGIVNVIRCDDRRRGEVGRNDGRRVEIVTSHHHILIARIAERVLVIATRASVGAAFAAHACHIGQRAWAARCRQVGRCGRVTFASCRLCCRCCSRRRCRKCRRVF